MSQNEQLLDLPAVGLDTPLRLLDALNLAFPRGGMTVSGLRREAAKGRLVIERIAGKDFVTQRAINEMRMLCRDQPKAPDCGLSQRSATRREGSYGAQHGSSEMGRVSAARAALELTARGLSVPCQSTSQKNTPFHVTAGVILLKS
jgi:hypothetical protein